MTEHSRAVSELFALIYPSFLKVRLRSARVEPGCCRDYTSTTSIPEIVGEAGILVDPLLDEQITNAMDELAEDENRLIALRLASLQRATSFSWEHAAQQTLDLYKSEVTKPKYRSEEKSVA
jgi:hypothetical protein